MALTVTIQQFQSGLSCLEQIGSRPFVFATVDPAHDELLFSIPKLSNTPPKGYMPDYPEMIYPFDILDFQGKTICYKLGQAGVPPHWQGSYSFNPEGFITLSNKLFSFKNGSNYEHNQVSSQNNFYGIQYTSKVMPISNMLPTLPKSYNNIVVQSNLRPLFVYLFNDYPIQQASDLVDISFNDLEGVWYAVILRNKLVPTATGYTTDGLLTGEKMRNVAMYLMFEFNPTIVPVNLKFIEIGFAESKGHRV